MSEYPNGKFRFDWGVSLKRMNSLLLICAITMALLQTTARGQTQFFVFKVKATLPAVMDIGTGGPGGLPNNTLRVTLNNNNIINLALGKPMSSPVVSSTEILGLSTTFEASGTNPVSTLIVYNPALSGTDAVVTTIATLDNLSWTEDETTSRDSGQGIASGNFLTTTLGNPTQNGFVSSPFSGSGLCSGPHIIYKDGHDYKVSPLGSATLISQIQFNYTETGKPTVKFNGFITNGMLSISGNAIGTYEVP